MRRSVARAVTREGMNTQQQVDTWWDTGSTQTLLRADQPNAFSNIENEGAVVLFRGDYPISEARAANCSVEVSLLQTFNSSMPPLLSLRTRCTLFEKSNIDVRTKFSNVFITRHALERAVERTGKTYEEVTKALWPSCIVARLYTDIDALSGEQLAIHSPHGLYLGEMLPAVEHLSLVNRRGIWDGRHLDYEYLVDAYPYKITLKTFVSFRELTVYQFKLWGALRDLSKHYAACALMTLVRDVVSVAGPDFKIVSPTIAKARASRNLLKLTHREMWHRALERRKKTGNWQLLRSMPPVAASRFLIPRIPSRFLPQATRKVQQ